MRQIPAAACVARFWAQPPNFSERIIFQSQDKRSLNLSERIIIKSEDKRCLNLSERIMIQSDGIIIQSDGKRSLNFCQQIIIQSDDKRSLNFCEPIIFRACGTGRPGHQRPQSGRKRAPIALMMLPYVARRCCQCW